MNTATTLRAAADHVEALLRVRNHALTLVEIYRESDGELDPHDLRDVIDTLADRIERAELAAAAI